MDIKLYFLGGYREQGRSCLVVEAGGRLAVFDAGVKKTVVGGYYGEPPYLDLVDTSRVNAVFISHLHEDHMVMVPALVRRGYNGPVYATSATIELGVKQWYTWAKRFEEDGRRFFTSEDVDNTRKLVKTIGLEEEVDLGWLRAKTHFSGHALGSVAFEIEVEGYKIVYMADTRKGSRVLASPWMPRKADVLITSAAYGDEVLRDEVQEKKFINVVSAALRRNQLVLVPATAVGRAQEVMAVLAAYRDQLPEKVQVLVHESARRGLEVLKKYQAMLNPKFAKMLEEGVLEKDPFTFFGDDEVEDVARMRGVIVLAPDLMLVRGPSRLIAEKLLPTSEMTLVLTGYLAPGTLGRLLAEHRGAGAVSYEGKLIGVRARVERIELKMHLDLADNLELLAGLQEEPRLVILHHGEEPKTTRLALALYKHLPPDHILLPQPPTVFHLKL